MLKLEMLPVNSEFRTRGDVGETQKGLSGLTGFLIWQSLGLSLGVMGIMEPQVGMWRIGPDMCQGLDACCTLRKVFLVGKCD